MYKHLARSNKKASTSNKAPYLVFNPHTAGQPVVLPSELVWPGRHVITVATIDPGIKNCGLRIAMMDLDQKGRITTIAQQNLNFTVGAASQGSDAKLGADTSYYNQATLTLNEYTPWFRACHYIIMESQLVVNPSLMRMSQHIITHLMETVANQGVRPLIIEIDSHLKSRMLGAPKMKKPALKKWCRNKAIEILTARGDIVAADVLKSAPKADDHGDTVCYEVIWWMILRDGLNTPYIPDGLQNRLRQLA